MEVLIMKNYTKYLILFFALVTVGCTSFDDMNKNPYALYETNAESFVQPILYNAEKTISSKNYDILSDIMQYTINVNFESSAQLAYNYVISEGHIKVLWGLYSQFGNAQYMLKIARTEENPAMTGVALVLRTFIAQVLTDTYGNIPYSKAGLIATQGDKFDYTTPYDDQKAIYIDMLRSLEEANACFNKAKEMYDTGALKEINFNEMCDFMYNGEVDKWHRFGNSLYLRLLMRASLKAIEESNGIISLGEEFGDINVIAKINEIYDSYLSGDGTYPVMRDLMDSARLKFSSKDSALYTSFYSTTSGNWNAQAACKTLTDLMLIDYKATNEAEGVFDPRYFRFFTKAMGAPTQLLREDMKIFFDTNVSSLGNSRVGRYTRGTEMGDNTTYTIHIGDLKMDPTYALLNYDEILFIFAEAGAREWIPMGEKGFKNLYLEANRQSILQWQKGWETAKDYYTQSSPEFINFINYLDNEFKFENAVETILRQKYVATFWVGVESWADYRRTGYPVLKTNGPAAMNKGILPTRLRYPATEEFQNAKWYNEAVNGWLGGDNNMQTDMWWASTQESQAIRRLGRQ